MRRAFHLIASAALKHISHKALYYVCIGDDEPKPDQVTTVLAIGVFITTAPPKVVKLPNLQFPCINLLRQSLQSENEIVSKAPRLATLFSKLQFTLLV